MTNTLFFFIVASTPWSTRVIEVRALPPQDSTPVDKREEEMSGQLVALPGVAIPAGLEGIVDPVQPCDAFDGENMGFLFGEGLCAVERAAVHADGRHENNAEHTLRLV
ncbi:MAG TPA: hypothetical protein VMR98_00385, partial [Candidatus Polarisedimenticolaceae bacterium]|nr:hypothetical protein [Candidatus Polarisedimenticolaceae bacterium]